MEPIAIIGIGCRLPRANNPAEFWQSLREGVDAITEVPRDRWDADSLYAPEPATPARMNTRWGGFLDRVDLFDPAFFGISGREAERMDPQQRLLLEACWESLEDAGVPADRLARSQTGVFVGISNSDYARLLFRGLDVLDAYSATGTALSIAANRISYLMNFRGPSIAVDTACSSSLVAVHLACKSLLDGESDLCIAGGVNLILSPEGTITFSQARMMAPDGRCKTFDARADGYVRGEGCGMLVLKPLAQARRDGDRVLAVILGSAVNQDGLTNGLTAPNGPSQQAVIRAALAAAAIEPAEVSYVEAHGTGTSLGDPIEVRALQTVLMQGRTQDQPCWLGSVKTNVGHLESAAGAAGLVKLVLSLSHREIPPHLHFRELNPYIHLENTPIAIPTALTPWETGGRRRVAGISAFGFGGTNCHMILAEAPAAESVSSVPSPMQPFPADSCQESVSERPRHLLTIRAKGPEALRQLATGYADHLGSNPDVPLADVCYTANAGRSLLSHRAAVAAECREEMEEELRELAARIREDDQDSFAAPRAAPKIAFLFTGQGSQSTGMGHALYETEPVFRRTLDQCSEILHEHLDRPLINVLYPDTDHGSPLDETAFTQPALFAFEYALAETWKSWGVEPSAALGHSVGEYVAACRAHVFSLEDGLKLVAARGRLMQALPRGGGMAAIFAEEDRISALIEPLAGKVSLAAVNGPRQVVISGTVEAVDAIVDKLDAEGVKTQRLRVSHAFHSPLMEPMLDEFERIVSEVSLSVPKFPIASNVTGRLVREEMTSPAYWRDHVRQAVRFEAGVKSLGENGFKLFLEIGPKPVLSGLGRMCLTETDLLWLPSLRPGRDDWTVLLDSLVRLFSRGVKVDWDGFHRPCRRSRVDLPTYPFQRQRYWGVDGSAASTGWTAPVSTDSPDNGHPLVGTARRTAGREVVFEVELAADRPAYLGDHKVFDTAVLPAAAFLEAATAAARCHFRSDEIVVEDVLIRRALPLGEGLRKVVQLVLTAEERTEGQAARFQIFSLCESEEGAEPSWLLHASGKVAVADASTTPDSIDLEAIRRRLTEAAEPESFYQALSWRGLNYGPAFRGVCQLMCDETEALGEIRLPGGLDAEAGQYALHPALLDAGFQVLAGLVEPIASGDEVFLPVGIRGFRLHGDVPSRLWSHVRISRQRAGRSRVTASVTLLAPDGRVVAEVERLLLARVSPEDLREGLRDEVERWLYCIRWQERPRIGSPTTSSAAGTPSWLLFCDRSGTGEQLAAELRSYGQRCVVVTAGSDFSQAVDDEFQIAPNRAEDYRRLLSKAFSDEGAFCRGVVHLWSLDSAADVSPLDAQDGSTRSVLLLVQALAGAGLHASPRLWLVTRGAQSVAEAGGLENPSQSPLWGLARVIHSEHPKLHCTRIDLDPDSHRGECKSLFGELWVPDKETEIAFRGGVRFASRLVQYESPRSQGLEVPDEPYQLRLAEYGVLDNLTLRPMKRREPADGEVEIAVRAAGLNFRDVLRAMGMLKEYEKAVGIHSAEDVTFGFECSGVVAGVGPGVTNVQVGDEVVALSLASMASHVTVDTKYVAAKPKEMSFEEAATIPLAYLTAYYGLCRLARLRPGEKVLIHSAAGGVGQAAVALAQHIGAEVYATASRGKWEFLRSLGIEHIADSRSLDFADDFQRLIDGGDGRGIDVILNALNGEYIPKSLSLLADGGRFVEIGKIGIWTAEQMAAHRPDVSYFPFDLGEEERDQPGLIDSMLAELLDKFRAEMLDPLPHQAFDVREAVAAFRLMQQAKHRGKVVLTVPVPEAADSSPVTPDASYLITGGLGALGLEVARWLVRQGARHVVLAGRRGEPSEAAQDVIRGLEQAGAEVAVVACDVSKADDVRRVVATIAETLPELRGIFHAAGVLDDGVLLEQDWDRFRGVMAPKLDGAWNCYEATKNAPLDFFVLFSSISSVLGSPGQGNYAAANAYLDSLAHYLRDRDVPALAVNWGPWRNSGMTAGQDTARWAAMGLDTIPPSAGLATQAQLLRDGAVNVGVFPTDWAKFFGQFPRGLRPPLLDEMASDVDERRKATSGKKAGVLNKLAAAPAERQASILEEFITGQVARTLGIRPTVLAPNQPLTEVGLDSLMGIELKNAVEGELDIEIPLERFGVDTTINDLVSVAGQSLSISLQAVEIPPADATAAHEGNGRPATQLAANIAEHTADVHEEETAGEAADLFDKCERFFTQPKVLGSGDRLLAAELFSCVSPPRNAGPWIEAEDGRILQFSSNDYLGLAMHPDVLTKAREIVAEYGIASPMGSRLMTGTTECHLELERKLAILKRCEGAIAFPSGAMAMIGMLACLGGPREVLVLDERAHASLVIGARASGSQIVYFRHNDLDHLESILKKLDRSAPRAIVVDGIYSMDGDLAPLPALVELKRKYSARLIVDDAHGTGVLGEGGRGTAAHFGVEDQIDLHAGTFSKAVGTIGGFVAGEATVTEFIRFHAPTMIFSKSTPLVVVAATLVSLDLLQKADDRRERLWENKRMLQEGLRAIGADIGQTESPITPIQLRGNDALHIADVLRKQFGIWVAPVIYPAVPVGSSILRLIPTALHSESDIRYLIDSFKAARAAVAAEPARQRQTT